MPFGIVTGFTEVEHITPHNLKALNAAVAGSGNYVLKIGKQLKASMQTANKLRILDGYGMMGGAQWGMEPGEYVDLTIDNGTQGMNRVDLVVARYDRTGAKNIESVTLRVIKGTPSSGTPSVPAYVTGDILAGAATAEMPLYKVQLSGLTVAAPVAMFEVLTPSKDAWDSVSHAPTIRVGTTIAYPRAATACPLWTAAQFKAITGHTYTIGRDFIGVSNGDADASSAHVEGVTIFSSGNGEIWITFDSATNSPTRIDWMIASAQA